MASIDKQRIFAAAVFSLCLWTPLVAQEQAAEATAADERNILYPRFRLNVGGFATFFNTSMRVDSEQLPGDGTEIDLEDDLGFNTKKFDFRADGFLRLGKRHRITFGYFNLSRSSNTVIDEEIDFGDEVFPIDTEVEADFRTAFALLGYRFSFLAREKVEVGIGLGLSAMFTRTGIAAVGTVGDEPIDRFEESTSVTFPVATLGLGASWTPIPRMLVRGGIGGLYVKIGTIQASIGNAVAAAEYYFIPQFGLGAGYAYTKLGVEETADPTVDISYRYSGLLIYGVFAP